MKGFNSFIMKQQHCWCYCGITRWRFLALAGRGTSAQAKNELLCSSFRRISCGKNAEHSVQRVGADLI